MSWLSRASTTALHLGEVPNLCDAGYEEALGRSDLPTLSVIVPALNEAKAVAACLRSLLASRGIRLEILAVNDRSTDATGAIMDGLVPEAAATEHTLRILHIKELPPGWLGKPHALALAARLATGRFLLFTDADAFYAPDALARCLRFVEREAADHLVLLPTPILKTAGERMMLGAIQTLAIFGVRLWKVADPRARDSIGVGCFNLLSREAYEGIGGFEALRMEVLEDLRLGFLVKRRAYRQRVAFGPDLLRLHWASGAMGIVRVMTKNFFALCRYQPLMLAATVGGTAMISLTPFAGLLGPLSVRVPSILSLLLIFGVYAGNARRTRISAGYALLLPLASLLLLYAMLRSGALTLARGGVNWRGTFYPLAELRRHARPLWPWVPRGREQ